MGWVEVRVSFSPSRPELDPTDETSHVSKDLARVSDQIFVKRLIDFHLFHSPCLSEIMLNITPIADDTVNGEDHEDEGSTQKLSRLIEGLKVSSRLVE